MHTSFGHTSMCTTQDVDEAIPEMDAYQSITIHTKSSDGKTDLLTRPWQKQVLAKLNIEQSGSHHNLIYPMSLLFFQCCFGSLKRFSRLADLLVLAKNAPDIVTFARKCILVQTPEPEGQPSIPLGICSCGKCCNGASLREQWMQARQTSRAQSLNIQSQHRSMLVQVNTTNPLLQLLPTVLQLLHASLVVLQLLLLLCFGSCCSQLLQLHRAVVVVLEQLLQLHRP